MYNPSLIAHSLPEDLAAFQRKMTATPLATSVPRKFDFLSMVNAAWIKLTIGQQWPLRIELHFLEPHAAHDPRNGHGNGSGRKMNDKPAIIRPVNLYSFLHSGQPHCRAFHLAMRASFTTSARL